MLRRRLVISGRYSESIRRMLLGTIPKDSAIHDASGSAVEDSPSMENPLARSPAGALS